MSDSWPSRYGAETQRRSLNEIRPEGVLAAARLVQRGTVVDLACGATGAWIAPLAVL